VLFKDQHYTKTPEEAAAQTILAGQKIRKDYTLPFSLLISGVSINRNSHLHKLCKIPVYLCNFDFTGLDLNCGDYLGKYTEGAVKQGLVDEAAINNAVSNNFATLMRLGFFDGDPSKQPYGSLGPKDVCTSENRELAREAARQGIVLLKNSAGSLPLNAKAIKSLGVIGPNANATRVMIGNYEGIKISYSYNKKLGTVPNLVNLLTVGKIYDMVCYCS